MTSPQPLLRLLRPGLPRGLPLLVAACLSLALFSACTPQPTQAAGAAAAQIAEFARTATARASSQGEAQFTAQAVQVQATATRQAAAATQAVQAAEVDASMQATAAAAAPLIAELSLYQVDPAQGQVGWLHPPITITVDVYHSAGYANDFPLVIARDFVIAGDVTWNSTYESAGCGFVLRASGDEDQPDQYIVVATGLGYGHIFFAALAQGKLANLSDFYVNETDPDFAWPSGSVNRLAVVGQGSILKIYSNYTLVGQVDTTQPPNPLPHLPPKPQKPRDGASPEALDQYEQQLTRWQQTVTLIEDRYRAMLQEYQSASSVYDEGFMALVAVNESGDTQCLFDHTWLWLIE